MSDRYRVYFCTAFQDGEYLKSRPLYCEYDLNFQNLLDASSLVILEGGGLGHFDEHGIFPFSPLKSGEKILYIYSFTIIVRRRINM